MTDSAALAEQQAIWGEVVPGWERWQAWQSGCQRPLHEWFCEAGGLAPGMDVLDVACGAGEPALTAAVRVKPGGRVVATDVSREMLAAARAHGVSRGLAVEFLEMDANTLDFPDASFDVVTCAFGLMFASDPPAAVREMLRVLRPGGRLAVAVWDKPARNPFLAIAGRAMAAVAEVPPPSADLPGPFRFCAEGAPERLLRTGGAAQVAVGTCAFVMAYDSVADYLRKSLDLAPRMAEKVAFLTAGDRERFEALVHRGAEPFLTPGERRAAGLSGSRFPIGHSARR